ncbi:uncharacterized protein [Dysidea avara]|uniref:uncharacterized protein n=1 Tax=Dysidea avara TaxID=196820 RepID=UPI003327D14D
MAETSDYRQSTKDFEIRSDSTSNMDDEPRSGHGKVMEPDSLLLCDYVSVRKVRTSKRKVKTTKSDNKLKKWKKGWVVVTIKEIENCRVDYHKDEDHWLTPSKSVNKISVCEPLKDIVCVEHIRSNYKFHVMSIIYESFSLLFAFKAQTTMTSWIERLNDIRQHYLVQLISSSNTTIKPAPYVLHVQSDKIIGYTAFGTKEVAWIWNTRDFFAYRLQKKIVPEVEIIIGIGSSAHGNFHFIGPNVQNLCKSIMDSMVTKSSDKPVKHCRKGDCEEETWGDMHSPKSSIKSPVLVNTLEPNPSYGVLPESPRPVHKSVVDETDQVVYDNDKIPEHKAVNDQPPGGEELELYVNDQPDEFEEYEYIQVKP